LNSLMATRRFKTWLNRIAAALTASLLFGCAADKARSRHTPCAVAPSAVTQPAPTAQRPVTPQAVQTATPNSVQLASFEQEAQASDAPRAEVISSPPTMPLGSDRPSLPLDLGTALGLTQGQNPRVAFAQAQIAQSLAVHDAARAL